jgi:large-conductance mechanosensitive channel
MSERKRKTPTKKSVAKLAATGTVIRFETPQSDRKPKPRKSSTAKVIVEEINPFDGFTGFLREYAVVGLSIGFIIGNQMSTLVKVIVASLVVPLTQLFFGKKLDNRTFYLRLHDHSATFNWGIVVDGLLQLVILLFLVYVAFRFFNLDKLNKPTEKK